jgi:hypothetical protein
VDLQMHSVIYGAAVAELWRDQRHPRLCSAALAISIVIVTNRPVQIIPGW